MALKKDKEKVIDPVWGEERIREFLDLQAPNGENADHHKVLKAYQSMRPEDFVIFLQPPKVILMRKIFKVKPFLS